MKVIPKYQKGGGFDSFFTTYTPLQTEAPRQTTSRSTTGAQQSSTEKGKLTEKDFFDMLKDIDGLPNEMGSIVTNLMNTFQLSNLTGADLGNLATTYLQNLYQLKIAAQNKKRYDDVLSNASKNGSLAEPAISMDGKLIIQNKDGSIGKIGVDTYINNKDEYSDRILTVSNLANMRKYDPQLAHDTSVFEIIDNSMGFEAFQNMLDLAKLNLGNSQFSESGIAGREALSGLSSLSKLSKEQREQILQNALEGIYDYTITENTNIQQIQELINYMNSVLPKRAKVWAAVKLGIADENEAANKLITQYLSGKITNSKQYTVDSKGTYDKVLGTKSGNGSNSSSNLMLEREYNTPMKWLEGFGVKSTFIINQGTTSSYQVGANTLPLTNSSGKPIGANSTLLQASQGEYSGILDFNNVSIGGTLINPFAFQGVVLSDGKISSIDYPIDIEAYNRDGSIIPDTSIKSAHAKQDADRELAGMGININNPDSVKENYKTINEVYQKYQLNPRYNADGSTTNTWRRFGVINAAVNNNLLGMDIFDSNPLLKEINDEATIDNLIQITKDEDFSKPGLFGGDHFYQGTVWIPVNASYQAASIGTKTTGEDVINTEYAEQARDARVNWKSGRQPK